MQALTRRTCLGLAAGATAVAASPVWAQEPPNTQFDRDGRLTAPVRINGQGPFAFTVDTAANRSVIAADLADALGLASQGELVMHTLLDRETAQAVRPSSIDTGVVHVQDHWIARTPRAGLGGSDGLLGLDLIGGRRVIMHFRGRRVSIGRSRFDDGSLWQRPRTRIRTVGLAQRGFGGLTAALVTAGGVQCLAIIDTGAETSICNTALARASRARPIVFPDGSRTRRTQSPTGRSVDAAAVAIPVLRLGGLSVENLPVLVGDFHTFSLWGLDDQPAMLLGVDVLRQFASVSLDLGRNEILFET